MVSINTANEQREQRGIPHRHAAALADHTGEYNGKIIQPITSSSMAEDTTSRPIRDLNMR